MDKKFLLITILLFCVCCAFGQVPVISSFSPASGPGGTTVTITGKNFNAIAANNIVYFGGVKAVVKTATATSLVVAVPVSAGYKQITVTTNGMVAASPTAFAPTYDGSGIHNPADPFAPQANLIIPNGPTDAVNILSINSMDLDGDGKLDLVALDDAGDCQIFKNTGSQALPFTAAARTVLYAYGNVFTMGDFDGDGKTDIIMPGASGTIFYKNTSTPGNISFDKSTILNVNGVYEAQVADMNGDGKLDIVANSSGNQRFTVYLNTSAGGKVSFAKGQDFITGDNIPDITVGDVDGDGKPDVVIADRTNYSVYVYRNTFGLGKLSFAARVQYNIRTQPRTVRLADIDGDGKKDIITTNQLDFGEISDGYVLRNIGKPGTIAFEQPVAFNTGGYYGRGTALADIDGDGSPDIATVDRLDGTGHIVFTKRSPGYVKFNASLSFGKFYTPLDLTVDDFNGDGRPDIAVANGSYDSSIAIFINQLYPNKPAITAFSPSPIASGAILHITGTGFTDATAVEFGGIPSPSFKVNSATNITAAVPDGAAGLNPNLTVTTPTGVGTIAGLLVYRKPVISGITIATYGTKNIVTMTGFDLTGVTAVTFDGKPALAFAVQGAKSSVSNPKFTKVSVTAAGGVATYNYHPAPVVSSVYPTTAGEGETVTITGSNFTGATIVNLNGSPAASFTVNSSTSITAKLGKQISLAAGAFVTTPGGSASGGTFTYKTTAPTITSFSPHIGTKGTIITVNGTGFTSSTTVTIGGKICGYSAVSPTQLSLSVGTGASGSIQVTNDKGSAAAAGFTYTTAPIIDSFSPATAASGQKVMIIGTGVGFATAVSFGGVPASSFVVNSQNMLTAVVGAGASGNVSIAAPGGPASLSGFTYIPAPTITSFTPAHAKTGETVVIKGTNFTNVTNVLLGASNLASYTVNSATQITAIVGDGGTGPVKVQTPGGTATGGQFTFDTLPVILWFSPSSAAAGTQVGIDGGYFDNVSAVSFGGVPAKSFYVQDGIWIVATPAEGSSGDITVTTPVGSSKLSGFKYISKPVITSISPAHAKSGDTVLITGSNLYQVTRVKLGTVQAQSFSIISDTQISAVVAGGESGTVYAENPAGSVTGGQFTYDGAPVITSASGNWGSAQPVTIYIGGYNLTGATKVTFGGVPASSFTVRSATSITAVIGAGASGDVVVTTPAGIAKRSGFKYYPKPAITSFTTIARPKQTVVIKGTGFIGVTAVRFGTVNAESFVVSSDKQIAAVVGAGETGNITVTATGGTATAGPFTYNPLPSINSVYSPSVYYNGQVTINGYNFTGATKVSFGGVPALSFTANTSKQITAVVGNGASGNLLVTTPAGTATYTGIVFNTQPYIISFSPKAAATGQNVIIKGVDFTNVYSVQFGNMPAANFHIDSPTQLTATVGAGNSGELQVFGIENSYGLFGFIYAPKPTVTSISPPSGGAGTSVTIHGTGFTPATGVKFGSVSAKSFNIFSDTQISAVAGPGESGPVSVESPGGVGTGGQFTFTGNSGISLASISNDDNAIAANLMPYPNPFTDVLLVNPGTGTAKKATVKIYNVASGRLVLQKQLDGNSGIVQVDVSALPAGVYSYHLVINKKENVYKIYKK